MRSNFYELNKIKEKQGVVQFYFIKILVTLQTCINKNFSWLQFFQICAEIVKKYPK